MSEILCHNTSDLRRDLHLDECCEINSFPDITSGISIYRTCAHSSRIRQLISVFTSRSRKIESGAGVTRHSQITCIRYYFTEINFPSTKHTFVTFHFRNWVTSHFDFPLRFELHKLQGIQLTIHRTSSTTQNSFTFLPLCVFNCHHTIIVEYSISTWMFISKILTNSRFY